MKRSLPILLLAAMTFSLLATTPLAAHEFVAETSISISSNKDSIKRGQQVKISGQLFSSERRCVDRELVTLYVDGVPVKAKQTRPNGKFNFKVRPAATADWHVEYDGRISGRHPHVHVCLASESNVVTIEVEDR